MVKVGGHITGTEVGEHTIEERRETNRREGNISTREGNRGRRVGRGGRRGRKRGGGTKAIDKEDFVGRSFEREPKEVRGEGGGFRGHGRGRGRFGRGVGGGEAGFDDSGVRGDGIGPRGETLGARGGRRGEGVLRSGRLGDESSTIITKFINVKRINTKTISSSGERRERIRGKRKRMRRVIRRR